MPYLARLAFVLLVLESFGASVAEAQPHSDPPVKVQIDVHVPAPVVTIEASPERSRHHHGPPAHREEPRPAPVAGPEAAPAYATEGSQTFQVPPDRVPGRGLCRIWYDDLPPDRQPTPMSCGRAHEIARRHGGRVIWAESSRAHQDGRVASAWYGHANFRGVPPDRLPPPGSCRVWLEGVPPDRQPPPGPCAHAEHEARRTGGRLLYMPAP